MSFSNVLASARPSAPELYPEMPVAEAEHYRTVAKKYRKFPTATHYTAVGLGSVAAALSVSDVATSLTGPGIIVGAPLGGIAALVWAAFAALAETSKKLGHKVTKHEKVYSLAVSKRASIQAFVSKAWNDNSITDHQFQLVISELEQYFKLKESVSTIESHKPPKENHAILKKKKNRFEAKFAKSFKKRF